MNFQDSSPFTSATGRLALPKPVATGVHDLLAALVERVEGPALTIGVDDWWRDIAEAHAATAAPPVRAPANLIVVNRLRALAPLASTVGSWLVDSLGSDKRLIFAEATHHHAGRFRASRFEPFDVTGELWNAGLSIIDVHRPVIESPDGGWEFALGIARVTPVRSL